MLVRRLIPVLLTLVLGLPAAAQDGVTVTYTVAASDLYTVTNNGGQPRITFTDCLTTNQTYTLDFTVAVTTDRSITATFATVGEGSFNFIPQGFTPPTIQTSGTGTDTVNVRGTFRTGPKVIPRSEDEVGIYLRGPNDSVLGDVTMSVRYACVAAPMTVYLPLVTTAPLPTAALRGTLAYVRDNNIYSYNLRTQQTQLLVTNGRDMEYSPDGTQLAFVRDDGVYVARADGSTTRRIAAHMGVRQPRWSDDGAKLLWERTVYHTDEIWTVALPQGTPTKIATGRDPAWAPDSLRVAYVTELPDDGALRNELRLVNWQGQRDWAVVTRIPPNTPPIGPPGEETPPDQLAHRMFSPVWNAAGTAIYLAAFVFYCCEGDTDIWERADATQGGSVFLDTLSDVHTVIGAPTRHAALLVSVGGGSGYFRFSARSLDPHVPDVQYAWADLATGPRNARPEFLAPAWSPESTAIAVLRCSSGICDLVVLAPGLTEPQVVLTNVAAESYGRIAWGRGD